MSLKHLYIISNYKFKKHTTLDRAQKERERLQAMFPNEVFRIYKVCSNIKKDGTKPKHGESHDIENDYKNPPDLTGPTPEILEIDTTPKISLANFKGSLLTQR